MTWERRCGCVFGGMTPVSNGGESNRSSRKEAGGQACADHDGIFGGMSLVSHGGEAGPRATYVGRGPNGDAPLAHRRPGYPLVGCSPAEPTAVSPGATDVPQSQLANKPKRLYTATSRRFTTTKDGPSVAKDCLFFVLTMGSTSNDGGEANPRRDHPRTHEGSCHPA